VAIVATVRLDTESVATTTLRGRANRRVAYVPSGSQKAVQPL
jgi:hypothetical protein